MVRDGRPVGGDLIPLHVNVKDRSQKFRDFKSEDFVKRFKELAK